MSLRQLNLTILADKVLEKIPRRSRSSFVSDAVIAYAKKKGVMEKYCTSKDQLGSIEPEIKQNQQPKTEETTTESNIPEGHNKGKVKVDSGY